MTIDQLDTAFDPEEIEDEDREYKVFTFKFFENTSNDTHDEIIKNWLNTGWNLYHEIVSPPFVILFFSREKEITE